MSNRFTEELLANDEFCMLIFANCMNVSCVWWSTGSTCVPMTVSRRSMTENIVTVTMRV